MPSCLCHALRSGTPAPFSLCTTWCVKLHRIAQSAFVYINIYQRQLSIVDQYAPLSGQVHVVTAELTWRFSSWQCQELDDNRRIWSLSQVLGNFRRTTCSNTSRIPKLIIVNESVDPTWIEYKLQSWSWTFMLRRASSFLAPSMWPTINCLGHWNPGWV